MLMFTNIMFTCSVSHQNASCCSNKCAECFFFLIQHLHSKIFMYLKLSIVYIHFYFLLISVFA